MQNMLGCFLSISVSLNKDGVEVPVSKNAGQAGEKWARDAAASRVGDCLFPSVIGKQCEALALDLRIPGSSSGSLTKSWGGGGVD